MNPLNIKRAYEEATPDDGKRILVDRYWPRGVKKKRQNSTAGRKKCAHRQGFENGSITAPIALRNSPKNIGKN